MIGRTSQQRDAIRSHLKRGLSLTPRQALDSYDCFRLAAVVWYLKHEELMNIKKTMVFNSVTKKVYARYYLEIVIELQQNGEQK